MPLIDDKVLELFREVAPGVEAFARTRQLQIDRYRKGKSSWELRFARQRGGEAAIVLSFREPWGHVIDVSAVWWVDNFATQTRRVHSEKIGAHYRRDQEPALKQLLEEAFGRIQAWTDADLGQPHGPYRDWIRTHTSESFAAERDRLPQH
jgi:hypothetical protein